MKFRWHKVGVLVGLAVLGLSAAWWLRSREPAYGGKPLSYWVEQLAADGIGRALVIRPTEPELIPWLPQKTGNLPWLEEVSRETRDDQAVAWHAIREIGTNGVPSLLRTVRRDDALHRRVYREIWRKAPAALRRVMPTPNLRNYARISAALARLGRPAVPFLVSALDGDAFHVRCVVVEALTQMGPEADTAVPRLVELLKEKDAGLAYQAMNALIHIGPAAVPGLIELSACTNSYSGVIPSAKALARTGLLGVMSTSRPQSARFEWLRDGLGVDSDPRHAAAVALWHFHRDSSGLGVLVSELKTTRDAVACIEIINVLGQMGNLAKLAVPGILEVVSNQDRLEGFPVPGRSLTEVAREALGQIDPEAAKKLETRW